MVLLGISEFLPSFREFKSIEYPKKNLKDRNETELLG